MTQIKQYSRFAILSLSFFALMIATCGCASKDNQVEAIKQSLATQGDIINKSGGDWSKLSPADQQALINGPGHGDAASAKAYLEANYARAHSGIPSGPNAQSSPNGK